VPLKNHDDWPKIAKQVGWKRWVYGPLRSRTKDELIEEIIPS